MKQQTNTYRLRTFFEGAGFKYLYQNPNEFIFHGNDTSYKLNGMKITVEEDGMIVFEDENGFEIKRTVQPKRIRDLVVAIGIYEKEVI